MKFSSNAVKFVAAVLMTAATNAMAEVPATVTTAFTTANADIGTVAWGLAVVAFIGTTIRIIRNRA